MTRRTNLVSIVLALALFSAACARPDVAVSTPPPVRAISTPYPDAPDRVPLVALEEWGDFATPTSVRAVAGDDDAWYIVDLDGKVWRYDGSERTVIIDVSNEIQREAEQGLYDFVVSPDGKYAYIHFTGTEQPYGDNHIREYRWTGTDVEGEPREVLVIPDPYPHHNGGQMQFGPDGYLYVGIGDGGTATLSQEEGNGDPHGNGQQMDELLGNVLRIDPRPSGRGQYTIPDDNPFVGRSDARDEVWAYGLRNPWKFSFDRQTGDLWLPDVGHVYFEEINFQPADSKGGQNYGWSQREGGGRYRGEPPENHARPVYVYPHRDGACAIIGGYVYRGREIPDLRGSYVFGDYCTGEIQAIGFRDAKVTSHRYLGAKVRRLVSFAEDRDGELFALSQDDGVFRMVPAS